MKHIPILILHGWNLSASKFLPIKSELGKRGYKVYCPDLPGFGKSESPEKPLFLSDFVNFVKKFLIKNQLNKIILIGHSFGGRISIKIASENPNILQSLILTGTPCITPVAKSKIIFFIFLAKVGRKLFSLPVFSLFQSKARHFLYRLAQAKDFYNTNERMRETFKNIVKEDLAPFLSKIDVQTLLLWGAEDKIVPVSIAGKINKLIKNSELSIIANARHGVPWTHPKEFADEVEKFINNL